MKLGAVTGQGTPRLTPLLFALALVLRFAFAMSQGIARPVPERSDEAEYDRYAWNLAEGRGYRGPTPDVSDQDHLTAYRPPGPSIVYAAVYVVVGHAPAAIRILNCVLSSLVCVLIVLVGEATVGRQVALLAAAGWAIWPMSIYLSPSLLSEQLGVVSLLVLVWAMLRYCGRPSVARSLIVGVLLGLNLMVHASRLFVIPLLTLWAVVHFRRSFRAIAMLALAPLATAVVMLPWIIRNEHVFGRFIPLSTAGGSALLQGNNRIVATDPNYRGYNIWDTQIPEYADAIRAPNDEVLRDSVAKSFAIAWIASHKAEMLPLALAKVRRGWTPLLQPGTAAILRYGMLLSWGPVLLLMLVGGTVLLMRFLRNDEPGWLLHAVIAHIVLINAVFFGYARYRYVVEPYCLLLAMSGLLWLISARHRQPDLTTR